MAELSTSIDTLGGVAGAIKRDGNKAYIYCYVQASALAGQPLVLSFTGVPGASGTNPGTATAATSSVYQLIVVPPVAQGATAGFQWCQFKGDAQVLVDGTTDVAIGDFLKCTNTATSLSKDNTTRQTTSVAISQVAYTTNSAALKAVYLLGDRVTI